VEKLTLELSVDEANTLLEALGEMPYRKVYELVVKIQQQASSQLGEKNQPAASPDDAEAVED